MFYPPRLTTSKWVKNTNICFILEQKNLILTPILFQINVLWPANEAVLKRY